MLDRDRPLSNICNLLNSSQIFVYNSSKMQVKQTFLRQNSLFLTQFMTTSVRTSNSSHRVDRLTLQTLALSNQASFYHFPTLFSFRHGSPLSGRGPHLRPELHGLRHRQEDAAAVARRQAERRAALLRRRLLGHPHHRHHGARREDQVPAAGKDKDRSCIARYCKPKACIKSVIPRAGGQSPV